MKNTKSKIFIIVAILLVVNVVIIVKSVSTGSKNQGEANTEVETEVYPTQSPEEVLAYYESNGEVIKKTPVNKARGVQTEAEAVAMLWERGFNQAPIKCPFDMDGGGRWDQKASEDSKEKHPVYETTYMTKDMIQWHIYLNDGCLLASSIAIDVRTGIRVIYSEQEYVLSYDTYTDSFYEINPDITEYELRVVDVINADLLETVTGGKEKVE